MVVFVVGCWVVFVFVLAFVFVCVFVFVLVFVVVLVYVCGVWLLCVFVCILASCVCVCA